MKKGVVVLSLLGILLVSPLVLAQEQSQTYSGFNRFVDNVKLFFSSGNNKVLLALEIKEKEVYSAIENDYNGDKEGASKNLKNAWKKLQMVQERVSLNVAEQVQKSSSEIREEINQKENLAEDFEVYVLEEEKTELTAEWVIEVEGKKGQTLKREVEISMGKENEQNRVIEIENRIDEIDNEIKNWVVNNDVKVEKDSGLTWEVKKEIVDGDDGLKPEVKKHVVGDGTEREDVVKDSDGGLAPGTDKGDISTDTSEGNDVITDTIEGGDCGDGVDCGDGSADGGVESGIFDDADSSDSGGDSGGESSDSGGDSGGESGITGEVVKRSNSEGLIKKVFNWLF